jgi:hypothetical protein
MEIDTAEGKSPVDENISTLLLQFLSSSGHE